MVAHMEHATATHTRTKEPRWPLMHAVLAHGHASPTHPCLARISGIGPRTVSKVTKEQGPEATGLLTRGHPAKLGVGAGLALGLSVGSQSVRGALVDSNGDMHCEYSIDPLMPDQLSLSPERLLARLRQVAATVLDRAIDDGTLLPRGRGGLPLLGAAVAWPSPLDRSKRPGGWALRHPAWKAVDEDSGERLSIPERMAATLGEPFTIDRCHAIHDASAHALCLAFHESRERTVDEQDAHPHMWRVGLVLRVGEGVSASAILLAPPNSRRLSFIDSKLIEGTKGYAGELGHLCIDKRAIDEINAGSPEALAPIDYDRWRCSCGRQHHLEAFASVPGLIKRLQASKLAVPDDGQAQERMLRRAREGRLGDALLLEAGTDVGRILGHALAGPILMLDPYKITVTGPLASEHLVKGITRTGGAWASVIDDSVKIDVDRSGAGDYIGVKEQRWR